MLMVALFSWWYGAGWYRQLIVVRETLLKIADAFSIDLLARTLFSPFRQISAGRVDGPIGVQLRAWGDKLFSRLIGAIVRSITILVGIIVLLISMIWGAAMLLIWPLLPMLPAIALLSVFTGLL